MTKNSQTARTSKAPEMLFLAELPDQSDYIWLLSFEDTRVALFHNNQAPRTTEELKPFLLAFPNTFAGLLPPSRESAKVFRWLWKTCCQNKRKIFFWLLLKDRLSTRQLLRRRHMFLEDYNHQQRNDF